MFNDEYERYTKRRQIRMYIAARQQRDALEKKRAELVKRIKFLDDEIDFIESQGHISSQLERRFSSNEGNIVAGLFAVEVVLLVLAGYTNSTYVGVVASVFGMFTVYRGLKWL